MNAIIETHGLTRRFRGVEAVHDLTFAIPEGKICAFLGPNGAGKTTTIKMLMNLLEPGDGTCSVMGIESRQLRAKHWQHIGYVSENQHLHEWMTVRQLLDYLRPFYPNWDREFEQRLLADFALPPKRKIKHLSRGMKMKLAMLTALAFRPRLLVLDEPFTGLDPLARDELVRGLLEFTSRGDWTVFMSSHDVEEVERLADWIVMIDAGRLVLSESTADLQARFRQISFVLDEPFPDSPAALALRLARPRALRPPRPRDRAGFSRIGNRIHCPPPFPHAGELDRVPHVTCVKSLSPLPVIVTPIHPAS